MAMTVPMVATVFERAASAPYAASARSYSAQAATRCRRAAGWRRARARPAGMRRADEGRDAVDEREVAPAQCADVRRRVAVAQRSERRDRAAEDELRRGQARAVCAGADAVAATAGSKAIASKFALLVVQLRDDDLRPARLVHPALELHDGGHGQEPEHPHARQQYGRTTELGDPASLRPAAAAKTGRRGVDERIGCTWHAPLLFADAG